MAGTHTYTYMDIGMMHRDAFPKVTPDPSKVTGQVGGLFGQSVPLHNHQCVQVFSGNSNFMGLGLGLQF